MKEEIDELMLLDLRQLELELVEQYDVDFDDGVEVSAWNRNNIAEKIRYLKEKVRSEFDKKKNDVKSVVCDELNYCSVVKNDRVNMVILILDTGIAASLSIPLHPIRVTVYAMRLGIFDALCEC